MVDAVILIPIACRVWKARGRLTPSTKARGVAAPLRKSEGEVISASTCSGLGLGGRGLLWPYSDHTDSCDPCHRPRLSRESEGEAEAGLRGLEYFRQTPFLLPWPTGCAYALLPQR